MIVTPRVKAFVNKHFGCTSGTIAGAPVEDNGGSGTAGAHWEKMFFFSEFMSGVQVTNPVISELTMALLEDSGWYKFSKGEVHGGVTIDYEPLYWLKNYGCEV